MPTPEPAPHVERTTLPNGVRVVTERIPTVRSVAVGAWLLAGSRDEAAEESGISHFIEHMVFKGTEHRRMHHIAQRLESVGGYLNAFTSKEYTCYHARALDEHAARALDTVLDLVTSPTFPEKEIEKEKEVVMEEMKMYEDTPEELIFDRFEGALYGPHPLGRPVLGFPETVQGFTREGLLAFVERHYRPERLVVAVAGNVEHGAVVRYAEKLTRSLEPSPEPLERPPANGYRPGELLEGRPVQQAHLVVGTRAPGLRDERRSVLSLLNTVLGGGMSSRLNQNIRERYGFCYNIYSFASMMADTGSFGVYMGTDEAKVGRARTLILRELDRLAQKPVSERALAQAKSQLKGALMLGLESMNNRMMRLGRIELTFGRTFSLDEVVDSVDAVTAQQLQDLAAELFEPERLSTVIFTPEA